jgi:hypothetical protein
MRKRPWGRFFAMTTKAGIQEDPQGGGSTHGLAQTQHQAQVFQARMDFFHLRLDFQQTLHARVVALG